MIPDRFVEQAGVNDMYAEAGLDRAGIVATVLTTLGIAGGAGQRSTLA